MPIEFEAPKPMVQAQFLLKTVGEEMMRSKSRYFDEHEHEIPWDYIEFMHTAMKAMIIGYTIAPLIWERVSASWSRYSASFWSMSLSEPEASAAANRRTAGNYVGYAANYRNG